MRQLAVSFYIARDEQLFPGEEEDAFIARVRPNYPDIYEGVTGETILREMFRAGDIPRQDEQANDS